MHFSWWAALPFTTASSRKPWLFTSAITFPPRAFTSSMFDTIFWCTPSFGAMNTTGIASSISAIGPCFISAAGYPSAWT